MNLIRDTPEIAATDLKTAIPPRHVFDTNGPASQNFVTFVF